VLSPALLLVFAAACTPAPPAAPVAVPFVVSSASVGEDGVLSDEYSCDGEGTSPALAWSDVPSTARSLAVVVSALGADGEVVLWTAWDIDPGASSLRPGILPTDHPPLQGVTSNGRVGWQPPCDLPPGAPLRIELAALDEVLLPPPIAPAAALRARMGSHLVGLARIDTRLP
jgi:phosphatidylethanolamine-binding protein (PEBP) family uncharacterized protein